MDKTDEADITEIMLALNGLVSGSCVTFLQNSSARLGGVKEGWTGLIEGISTRGNDVFVRVFTVGLDNYHHGLIDCPINRITAYDPYYPSVSRGSTPEEIKKIRADDETHQYIGIWDDG